MDDSLNLLEGLDIEIPEEVLKESSGGPELDSPEFFGPYHLIQEVGLGGVARVFRGRHIHPRYAETTFAVKILHEELSRDPQVVGLFRNEAYVLAMLNHPNIVKTFEAGAQDEKLFIAMEYIDGRDLDELAVRCQRARLRIPIPVALHIIGDVLKGLAYAHELSDADGNHLNLVHRDVNPANVFLSYDGRIKLGDFGVAAIAAGRVEKSRELAGKVGYFSPEQIACDQVDHRADIFSTGVMLYEIICGARLFSGADTNKVMRLNRRAKIPKPSKANPNISPRLEEVMLRALERRPNDRFSNASKMLEALGPFLPEAKDMSLAVAALMRKVFLKEHVQELQLREGLAGVGPGRGSGQLVAVFSRDERAQAAFNELLLSRGYRVETHEAFDTLAASTKSGNPPAMLLLDVCSEGFFTDDAVAALREGQRPVPVVAFAEGLDPKWIKAANDLGAVDLLFKPFNVERVLTAVRSTVTGAARIANATEHQSGVSQLKPRVLVVSSDPSLGMKLTTELAAREFEVELSPTTAEAVQRSNLVSFQAVVYDAHPASPADQLFAGQYRGQPGMGLVPILFLAEPQSHSLFAGVDADRCAVRSRDDPPVVFVETINRLRADVRLGRTFVRYASNFPVELRYGGRVFDGEAVDISRGGVMLRCEHMPPIRTAVSVTMRPLHVNPPIEANGRVVRVDLPKDGHHHQPGIGVEFERFSRRGEAQLIAFLATLDSSQPRSQTVILGIPSPKKT
ncbi:protein kinase [Myxococcota bacterium]